MMRKINLWHYMCVLLLLVAAVQGCRKDSFYGLDDGGKPDDPLLYAAKVWHQQNLEFAQKKKAKSSDLDITKLHFQWDKHGISKNQQGKPVLTVPIRYAGQGNDTYVELGFIVDAGGNANGMIKEYFGDPFVSNTPLNLYSGTGNRFLSGTFIRSRKSMAVDIRRSQGLKAGLQKLASTGGGGGDTTINGGTIEEVLVTAQQNNWGGGGGTYLGIISGGVFHEGGISDNEPPPNSNTIEAVTVMGYTTSGNGSDAWYQGTYSPGDFSSIPVTPGVAYVVVAADPNKKLTTVPSGDSCFGRYAVNERLNIPLMRLTNTHALNNTKNVLVGGKNVEYGYETLAKDLVTFEIDNNPLKSGTVSNVNFSTRWSAATGYTIGYTHTHPNNSAPSPSDLFIGTQWYNTVPVGERSIFAGYYTSTIITDDYLYVVTVKDETKWAAIDLSDPTARTQANTEYQQHAQEFFRDTQRKSRVEAAEYALLTMYGDAVNIYRSPNNGTLNFSALRKQLGMAMPSPCN
ncbi:hypothetical protein FAZ19_03760 [Sphingobacterium alkalisoli]|uniref:Uncharacterized protein n=1 Tax=Sphingobacterium alkalisoli TaxID=1874115 RepID=A0A4U0H974_9SPHI|nr:hypothetical protein [Sphingobacterium alkalisoli]TJY68381.1 hypothetical protein FAZ19_03760 [Sphingobacterium alkalisoli]GGH06881.1 hypothetical protein GCM10011418_03800 [Sphingobacterium alkalisoli]